MHIRGSGSIITSTLRQSHHKYDIYSQCQLVNAFYPAMFTHVISDYSRFSIILNHKHRLMHAHTLTHGTFFPLQCSPNIIAVYKNSFDELCPCLLSTESLCAIVMCFHIGKTTEIRLSTHHSFILIASPVYSVLKFTPIPFTWWNRLLILSIRWAQFGCN